MSPDRMSSEPRRPVSVRFCRAILALASWLVPPAQRRDWKLEWESEIWHRWQFLLHAGGWSRREAWLLLKRCLGAFPDAFWQVAGDPAVQNFVRKKLRSPLTCLASLGLAILVLAALTWGFPATRDLLAKGFASTNGRIVFIWFHPNAGGGDEGLPGDAVAAWASHSRKLEGIAPFAVSHLALRTASGAVAQPLVVRTEPALFRVMGTKPRFGQIPDKPGVVLTDSLWHRLYRGDRRILGAKMRLGREWYPIAAVLPPSFRFLTRQPAAYLVRPYLSDAQLMVVGRVHPGVTEKALDRELTQIAETVTYYFFRGELRYSSLREAAWTPIRLFAAAAAAIALLVLLVSRVPLRRIRKLLQAGETNLLIKRSAFFAAKIALASAIVFIAGLEWSRPQSALLYGSRDPAAGPLLLWLYILGTMGAFFWAVADQRVRCRVCLTMLCLPVRVGCPGCVLLNWSGTELLCPEGHGLMHVPDLCPSWDEESEHWISLDDSWKDLFAGTR